MDIYVVGNHFGCYEQEPASRNAHVAGGLILPTQFALVPTSRRRPPERVQPF
jgi:hypothetical protein